MCALVCVRVFFCASFLCACVLVCLGGFLGACVRSCVHACILVYLLACILVCVHLCILVSMRLCSHENVCGSAVERQILNREIPGLNPLCIFVLSTMLQFTQLQMNTLL